MQHVADFAGVAAAADSSYLLAARNAFPCLYYILLVMRIEAYRSVGVLDHHHIAVIVGVIFTGETDLARIHRIHRGAGSHAVIYALMGPLPVTAARAEHIAGGKGKRNFDRRILHHRFFRIGVQTAREIDALHLGLDDIRPAVERPELAARVALDHVVSGRIDIGGAHFIEDLLADLGPEESRQRDTGHLVIFAHQVHRNAVRGRTVPDLNLCRQLGCRHFQVAGKHVRQGRLAGIGHRQGNRLAVILRRDLVGTVSLEREVTAVRRQERFAAGFGIVEAVLLAQLIQRPFKLLRGRDPLELGIQSVCRGAVLHVPGDDRLALEHGRAREAGKHVDPQLLFGHIHRGYADAACFVPKIVHAVEQVMLGGFAAKLRIGGDLMPRHVLKFRLGILQRFAHILAQLEISQGGLVQTRLIEHLAIEDARILFEIGISVTIGQANADHA